MSCSKFDKQQSMEMLTQVNENNHELREHLLRERFKVEHLVHTIRDSVPEEIEFVIPRGLMIQLLGGHQIVKENIETDPFTEGDWVSGRSETLGKYFKDGKSPMLFKQLDIIGDDDDYFNDETSLYDYYLDGYEIRRRKAYGARDCSVIQFEIKLKFVKEEMVECCITADDVPKRSAYYNGDVYMSEDAYSDFTRCQC